MGFYSREICIKKKKHTLRVGDKISNPKESTLMVMVSGTVG